MAIQVAALVSALAPALKMLIASEAVNLARKYIFDTRTKGGHAVKDSIYKELEGVLSGMSNSEWGKILKQVNGDRSYKKKAGEWIGELLFSGLGTGLQGLGEGFNVYNSLLADTVSNALNSLTNPRQAAAWGNPYAAGANIFAGGKRAQGALAGVIGNAAGGWFNNLSQQIRNENMQNRMTRMMLDNHLSGEAMRQLRLLGNGGGGGGGGAGGASSPSGGGGTATLYDAFGRRYNGGT